MNFLLRINIYIDAQLAEVISYQQEKPVPFFVTSPFSQSQDEKYQQNRILTEWLEIIFLNGAIDRDVKRKHSGTYDLCSSIIEENVPRVVWMIVACIERRKDKKIGFA